MNLLPRWVRKTSEALRRGNDAPEPDPGDMGTAFGLDATFAPQDEHALLQDAGADNRPPWGDRLERRPRR